MLAQGSGTQPDLVINLVTGTSDDAEHQPLGGMQTAATTVIVQAGNITHEEDKNIDVVTGTDPMGENTAPLGSPKQPDTAAAFEEKLVSAQVEQNAEAFEPSEDEVDRAATLSESHRQQRCGVAAAVAAADNRNDDDADDVVELVSDDEGDDLQTLRQDVLRRSARKRRSVEVYNVGHPPTSEGKETQKPHHQHRKKSAVDRNAQNDMPVRAAYYDALCSRFKPSLTTPRQEAASGEKPRFHGDQWKQQSLLDSWGMTPGNKLRDAATKHGTVRHNAGITTKRGIDFDNDVVGDQPHRVVPCRDPRLLVHLEDREEDQEQRGVGRTTERELAQIPRGKGAMAAHPLVDFRATFVPCTRNPLCVKENRHMGGCRTHGRPYSPVTTAAVRGEVRSSVGVGKEASGDDPSERLLRNKGGKNKAIEAIRGSKAAGAAGLLLSGGGGDGDGDGDDEDAFANAEKAAFAAAQKVFANRLLPSLTSSKKDKRQVSKMMQRQHRQQQLHRDMELQSQPFSGPAPPSTGLPPRTVLIAKQLSRTDASSTKIRVPAHSVRHHFPMVKDNASSMDLHVKDHVGQGWNIRLELCIYSTRETKQDHVYRLTQMAQYIHRHGVKQDDIIAISRSEADGTLLIEYNTQEACDAAGIDSHTLAISHGMGAKKGCGGTSAAGLKGRTCGTGGRALTEGIDYDDHTSEDESDAGDDHTTSGSSSDDDELDDEDDDDDGLGRRVVTRSKARPAAAVKCTTQARNTTTATNIDNRVSKQNQETVPQAKAVQAGIPGRGREFVGRNVRGGLTARKHCDYARRAGSGNSTASTQRVVPPTEPVSPANTSGTVDMNAADVGALHLRSRRVDAPGAGGANNDINIMPPPLSVIRHFGEHLVNVLDTVHTELNQKHGDAATLGREDVVRVAVEAKSCLHRALELIWNGGALETIPGSNVFVEGGAEALPGFTFVDCMHWCGTPLPNADDATFSLLKEELQRPLPSALEALLRGRQPYRVLVAQDRSGGFISRGRGWGLIALDAIPKGSMVLRYLGDHITVDEEKARRKGMEAHCSQRGTPPRKYFQAIVPCAAYETSAQTLKQKRQLDASPILGEGSTGDVTLRSLPCTVVDSALRGGPARFLNHSCTRANVWPQEMDVLSGPTNIVYTATRDIKAGEELLLNYHGHGADTNTVAKLRKENNLVKCTCGEDGCLGWTF